MTFKEQSRIWLTQLKEKKKNPLRSSSLKRYSEALSKHLNPFLGDLDLSLVGNKTAKAFVSQADMSPASVNLNLYILKAVVKSYIDEEGNQLLPRTWNGEFIDAPVVENQNAPELPLELLQGTLKGADKGLYALLAGSGLRIEEAVSLTGTDEGGNYWDKENSLVNIRRSKTNAGIRLVDLDSKLNTFLKETLPETGKLFLKSQSTLRRHLSNVAGITDFHRFRRFRVTQLDKENVPEGLKKFWIGHAVSDISEKYSRIGRDIQARKEWVKRAGLGFSL